MSPYRGLATSWSVSVLFALSMVSDVGCVSCAPGGSGAIRSWRGEGGLEP